MKKEERTIARLSATDEFGRSFGYENGFKKDKYVGMFYFLWHGQEADHTTTMPGIFNISELEKNNKQALLDISEDNKISPVGAFHHWGEPLFGYYSSCDEWVLRKHMEMLTLAGVDFITFDCTNDVEYWSVLEVLFPLMSKMQNEGWNVPKFMFYLNSNSKGIIDRIYRGTGKGGPLQKDGIYKNGNYKELWFMPNGDKPLIAAITAKGSLNGGKGDDRDRVTDEEILNFFEFKESQWPIFEYYENGFPWIEWTRPQPVHTDVINVSIAQHNLCPFSDVALSEEVRYKMWGRGYTTEFGTDHSEEAILKGKNFEEEWSVAHKADVKYTFVTGWNEWAAIKFVDPYRKCFIFVDSFNLEFSRDIEPMKGGYNDTPYMQLVRNIRKLKGLGGTLPTSPSVGIKWDSFANWEKIEDVYGGFTGQTYRDSVGFAKSVHYKDESRRMEIEEVKVAHSEDYLYFMVNCNKDLSSFERDEKWLNVLLGFEDGNCEFDFIVGRGRNGNTCSIEKFGSNKKLSNAEYFVHGKTAFYKIKKSDVNIKGPFTLRFKVADNVDEPCDIMSYYKSGCSFPIGRFGLLFRG